MREVIPCGRPCDTIEARSAVTVLVRGTSRITLSPDLNAVDSRLRDRTDTVEQTSDDNLCICHDMARYNFTLRYDMTLKLKSNGKLTSWIRDVTT